MPCNAHLTGETIISVGHYWDDEKARRVRRYSGEGKEVSEEVERTIMELLNLETPTATASSDFIPAFCAELEYDFPELPDDLTGRCTLFRGRPEKWPEQQWPCGAVSICLTTP